MRTEVAAGTIPGMPHRQIDVLGLDYGRAARVTGSDLVRV